MKGLQYINEWWKFLYSNLKTFWIKGNGNKVVSAMPNRENPFTRTRLIFINPILIP